MTANRAQVTSSGGASDLRMPTGIRETGTSPITNE
jgi:hypothetical protein